MRYTIKLFFVLVVILIISEEKVCYAQSVNQLSLIDSLEKELLKDNLHDTVYFKLKLQYGEENSIFRTTYWDSIATGVESVLPNYTAASIKKRLKIIMADAINNTGYVYKRQGNIEEGLKRYKKSLIIRKEINDTKGISTSLNNIGMIYHNQGNIQKALEYYSESLKIREETDDRFGIGVSLSNIGGIYKYQGDFDQALNFFNRSLAIRKEVKDRRGEAATLNNIGALFEQQDSLIKALDYYKQTLIVDRELGSSYDIGNSLNNIGVIYMKMENGKDAIVFFNEALLIERRIENLRGLANTLKNISDYEFHYGSLVRAEKYGLESFEISQKIGHTRNIKIVTEYLTNIYEKQGKGIQALEMHKLYITMRDSLNNIKTQKATIKQQTKYEYDKQKAVDDVQNEKLVAIEKEEKEKQQIISYTTAGGLCLTGIFLFFVFNRLKVTRKQKTLIEEQKLVVENQKEEVEAQRDIAHSQKLIVEEKNKEILESITYAKRIQEAILPPPRLVKEWLTESFIFYKPKDIVAGDFYWMETATYTKDEKEKTLVYFAAADCTGHRVPGAMVSVVCANALNRAVKEFNLIEPGHVLDKVTELVIEAFEKSEETIKDGMDIALCALDISAKKVFYSGANNPLYRVTTLDQNVVVSAKTVKNETHQLVEYVATKQPVGQHDNLTKFNTIEIQLEPGDAVYVFSDGFPDQFGGAKGKKYKYSTFRKSLLANFHHPMETQKQLLENEFNNWKGDLEQIDDVCVIGVKINGKEKNNFTPRELEVLIHLETGLPSKLIADKMNISKNTVDTYRRRLLAKTGTYNATELINYCIKKEII